MDNRMFKVLLILLNILCMDISSAKEFKVFDGMMHKGKPDLSEYGIEPTNIVYEYYFFDKNKKQDASPSLTSLRKIVWDAKKKKTAITILDIERWVSLVDAPERYLKVVNQFRWFDPKLKIGFYAVVPSRDYWRATKGSKSKEYKEWQIQNDKFQEVGDNVDYICPSIYTFYDYQPGWIKYAEENIKEAKRLAKGKPVYVFLWPMYHESNKELQGKFIPVDFWKLQLDLVYRLADGVIIWGGGSWDESAEWWKVTQQFLIDIKKSNN